jgi:hypothetical protein
MGVVLAGVLTAVLHVAGPPATGEAGWNGQTQVQAAGDVHDLPTAATDPDGIVAAPHAAAGGLAVPPPPGSTAPPASSPTDAVAVDADADAADTAPGRTGTGPAGATPLAAAAAAGGGQPVLGVTVFAMWRDWDRADELLDRAQQSGSPWLRVDMGWCSLEERGPGEVSAWYQDRLDAVVAGADRRGLRLLMMVACAPEWAGGTATGSYPDDPAQFQRVTRYLADRYRGRVQAWEIWNEPDCIGGCPNGSPAAFVPVLQAGYRGIKAGDPAATVVSGGISGNNAGWIARMYAAGAQGWFDALAVHPYLEPVTAAPAAPPEQRIYRMTSVAAVYAVMQRNGDGDKDIWFTEFGWTTADTGDRPGVDETTQARYLQQAVELIARDYPYVTHAFWFALRDRDDWTPYENEFGLLHVDGSAKPAYAALRAANAWLAAS